MNSKEQYKLNRSFRGGVLKSMRLLSSVNIQKRSVDVILYAFFILGPVPLILTQTIVFMIVSAFDYLLCRCLLILRSTLTLHHESQFGSQYLLGQSLIYAFQSLPQLFEHDTGCTL